MPSPSRTQDVRHEPAPLERSSIDLLVSDPYVKGASFESFEAAKDALLRHTVARGLSYKVLRSDKNRSRYLVSCSLPSCPFRIRFGPNASGGVKTTVVVPHNCPPEAHLNWGRANSVKALRPRHQDRYRLQRRSHPQATRNHGDGAMSGEL
jgi:MuDR family transposase